MGRITFKEGGSIQFKGGTLTFLSYTPMAEPTVTIQWIYDSTDQKYKGKIIVKNNDSHTATIAMEVFYLGEDIYPSDITLAAGATSSPIYIYGDRASTSPDNNEGFSVLSWARDPNGIRPNSNEIYKQTTADFRIYIYNTGIGGMQELSQGYTYGNSATYSITPTVDYLEVTAQSTSLYQVSNIAVRTTVDYYMSTDDAMVFEYTAQGSTDMDFFTFARASNWDQDTQAISPDDKIDKRFSSSWTDGRVSLSSSQGGYHIMQITSIDWPLYPNKVRIKKVYIETKENGEIV